MSLSSSRGPRDLAQMSSRQSDLNHPSSDESGKDFDIEGLLDKRIVDNATEYQVQWPVPFAPSWEPAANISAEAIAEFEKNNAGKAKKGNAKRGRPRTLKKKQVPKPTANAPRTRSATKAAQQAAKEG